MQGTGTTAVASALDAVRSLVHRYADAVCRNDTPAWSATWADDASWEIGRGPVVGVEAITAAYERSIGMFEAVIQVALNGEATVDEAAGTGHGRWYIQEFGRTVSGRCLQYLGFYDDTYVRTAPGWVFASRTLTWLYQGPPDLSGEFGPPVAYRR